MPHPEDPDPEDPDPEDPDPEDPDPEDPDLYGDIPFKAAILRAFCEMDRGENLENVENDIFKAGFFQNDNFTTI